jgi:exodeoxyribonuclease VII small subunit
MMATTEPGGELSFEEAFSHLEEIVQRLEEGDLPLQEALDLYDQGMTMARRCQTLLDDAEMRVTQLLESLGEVREEPFEKEG